MRRKGHAQPGAVPAATGATDSCECMCWTALCIRTHAGTSTHRSRTESFSSASSAVSLLPCTNTGSLPDNSTRGLVSAVGFVVAPIAPHSGGGWHHHHQHYQQHPPQKENHPQQQQQKQQQHRHHNQHHPQKQHMTTIAITIISTDNSSESSESSDSIRKSVKSIKSIILTINIHNNATQSRDPRRRC